MALKRGAGAGAGAGDPEDLLAALEEAQALADSRYVDKRYCIVSSTINTL